MQRSSYYAVQVTVMLAVVLATLVAARPAQAKPLLQPYDENLVLSLCSYVRANDSIGFRDKLRDYRLRIRDIYSDVRCNHSTMIQFAIEHRADDIGRLLVLSISPRDLAANGDVDWVRQHSSSVEKPTSSLANGNVIELLRQRIADYSQE